MSVGGRGGDTREILIYLSSLEDLGGGNPPRARKVSRYIYLYGRGYDGLFSAENMEVRRGSLERLEREGGLRHVNCS